MKSKLKFLIPGVLHLLIAITVFFPWASVVESIAIEKINEQGFGPAKLNVDSIGVNGIRVKDISVLNGGIQIKLLEVDWSLTGLMSKSISDLRVYGVKFEPESLPKTKNEGDKESKVINFQSLVDKIPTEKFEISINVPNKLAGHTFSERPVSVRFQKKEKSLILDFFEGLEVAHEKYSLKLWPSVIIAQVKGSSLFVYIKNMKANVSYQVSPEEHGKLRFDEIVTDRTSFVEIRSTENGITPNEIELALTQARGAYGKDNINWGVLNLKISGLFDDLSFNGGIKNINHVSSKCLMGMDLDFNGNKKEAVNFKVHTPASRKDLLLDISGNSSNKVNFKLVSKDLSMIDFKKSFPCVGKDISNVKGNLGLYGFKNFSKPGERIDLKLEKAGFQWDEMKVSGVDIKSNVINFSTLKGATPSEVKIKKVALAFDLTNIDLKYLMNKNQVEIQKFQTSILGGKLWADSFIFDRKESVTQGLVIQADNLPLNDVLKVGLKDAVMATGQLQGRLPINWLKKTPVVKNGLLETKGSGVLKYNPRTINPLEKTGNSNVNLLSKYLENLNYSKLSIDVDSDEKYNLQMKSKILGKNPAVNNGRPLKFGFNLGLDIRDTIYSYMALMKIPKKMEQNFLKKLQK